MTILIVILFIWVLFIQFKLTDISESLKNINKRLDHLASSRLTSRRIFRRGQLVQEDPVEEDIETEPIKAEETPIEIKEEVIPPPIIEEEEQEEIQELIEEKPKEEENIAIQYKNNDEVEDWDEGIELSYDDDDEEEQTVKKEVSSTQWNPRINNKPKPIKKDNSLENLLLGNIFNIIGALAIIIGCGIFIKLISPFIIFTPLMKTLIGILAGTSMVTIGCTLKRETLKGFSEVLIGTGFSVLFITIYCTTVLFQTFSLPVCTILGILILLASYYIADRQKTISMIAIALIGGYLNVFLVATSIHINAMFVYLIFLNLLSIIFVYRNPDKSVINIINIIMTFIFTMYSQYKTDDFSSVQIHYPVALWALYLIFDCINRHKSATYDINGKLNWVNFFSVLAYAYLIYSNSRISIGLLLIVICMVYDAIVCYCIVKNSDRFKPYLYTMLTTILLAVYFLAQDLVLRNALWCLVAIVLSFIIFKYKREYLQKWVLIFLSCAITSMFFIKGIYFTEDISKYTPVFNHRLLAFLAPLCSTYIAYFLIGKLDDRHSKNLSEFLKFCSVSLLYLFIIFELNQFINVKMNANNISPEFIKYMLYSIIGFKYALQMKRYEIATRQSFYVMPAILIGVGASILLLLKGMVYEPMETFIPVINIRCIAFVFAIVSVLFFEKWTKLDMYRYLALALGFILLTVETLDTISKFDLTNSAYIMSIVWSLYALVIKIIGTTTKNPSHNIPAIFVGTFATAALFAKGFTYYPIEEFMPIANIRFLAFVTAIATTIYFIKATKLDLYRYVVVILSFILLTIELLDSISKFDLAGYYLLVIGWLLYTLGLKIYEIRTKSLVYSASSILVGIASMVAMLFTCLAYEPLEDFNPIINIRFLIFSMAIAITMLFSKYSKSDIYKYIAVTLGFLLITVESNDFIEKHNVVSSYIISMFWIIYTGILTMVGIFKNNQVLKNSGICISILAVLRIFIYDMANVEMIYKLIVLITLGSILMLSSYFYNKYKK